MDLNDIVTEGHEFEVIHPSTQEPVGLTLMIVADDDAGAQKERRRIQDARRFKLHGREMTAAQEESDGREILAACIKGWVWHDGLTFNGATPEFSAKAMVDVMKAVPFIALQVAEEVSNYASFFGDADDGSAGASST